MKQAIREAFEKTLKNLDMSGVSFRLEYPEDPEHGDFSCNVAMMNAKKLGLAPKVLAEKIVAAMNKEKSGLIDSISVAGPGFINVKIKHDVFAKNIVDIAAGDGEYGWSKVDAGKKVMVEYTDPNPFKVLHIGHLMSNAIGESISRLVQTSGAAVIRANWQGDVGPHVAKAIWGAMHMDAEHKSGADFWGKAYTHGALAYEDDASAKKAIDEINKKVYARSDDEINKLYDQGRKESLEAFEAVYARLGTKFDNYFFEGIEGRNGEPIVREFVKKGVFQESEGAIVFKGEDHGLHTRVFITSQGLPTYETKELGLNAEKFKIYPDLTESVIITANEQNDYFRVLLKVLELVMPDIAAKTKHMGHGMMRFAAGKMSSRKGNVISAEALIADVKALVMEKLADREMSDAGKDVVADTIAIGAIKYTILRQSVGSDVIFDSVSSISFEGDSGPYLQYAAVRAGSILGKIKNLPLASNRGEISKIKDGAQVLPEQVTMVEKLISRFPDVVERARVEYAPQHIAAYLMSLAGEFNAYYAQHQIIDENDPVSPYRVALTKAFRTVMVNGLWVLGITVPGRM